MARNLSIRTDYPELLPDEAPHGCYEGWVYLGFEGEDDESGEPPFMDHQDVNQRMRRRTMIIKLERIPAPEDMGPATCGICTATFEQGVVYAYAVGDGDVVCPECIAFRAAIPPDASPQSRSTAG